MSHDAVELPRRIAIGMRKRLIRSVTRTELSSGYVVTNTEWSRAVRVYEFDYSLRPAADIRAVEAFWDARDGGLRSFLFFDHSDPVATAEPIGTGDAAETVFPLTLAGERVQAVVAGAQILVGGTPLGSGVTIDATGRAVFDTAPADGAAIAWSGTALRVVRFDADDLDVGAPWAKYAEISGVRLREHWLEEA